MKKNYSSKKYKLSIMTNSNQVTTIGLLIAKASFQTVRQLLLPV